MYKVVFWGFFGIVFLNFSYALFKLGPSVYDYGSSQVLAGKGVLVTAKVLNTRYIGNFNYELDLAWDDPAVARRPETVVVLSKDVPRGDNPTIAVRVLKDVSWLNTFVRSRASVSDQSSTRSVADNNTAALTALIITTMVLSLLLMFRPRENRGKT
jgi:hypothetical protein